MPDSNNTKVILNTDDYTLESELVSLGFQFDTSVWGWVGNDSQKVAEFINRNDGHITVR